VFRFWIIKIDDERHDDSKLKIDGKVYIGVGSGNESLTRQANPKHFSTRIPILESLAFLSASTCPHIEPVNICWVAARASNFRAPTLSQASRLDEWPRAHTEGLLSI
jgi:hypothetical protein